VLGVVPALLLQGEQIEITQMSSVTDDDETRMLINVDAKFLAKSVAKNALKVRPSEKDFVAKKELKNQKRSNNIKKL